MNEIPPNKTSEPLITCGSHHPFEPAGNGDLTRNSRDPILTNAANRKNKPVATRQGTANSAPETGTAQLFTEKNRKVELWKGASLPPIAVTIQQAAILVGTNDKQIRRAIYAREIPVARLGKSYSIAVADLIQWFDRRKAFL
jgi:excisionase family DNA binding protein